MAPFFCVRRKYEEKNVQEEIDLYHFVKLLHGGGKRKGDGMHLYQTSWINNACKRVC